MHAVENERMPNPSSALCLALISSLEEGMGSLARSSISLSVSGTREREDGVAYI